MIEIMSVRDLKNILDEYQDDDSVILGIHNYDDEGAEAILYVSYGKPKRGKYKERTIMEASRSAW